MIDDEATRLLGDTPEGTSRPASPFPASGSSAGSLALREKIYGPMSANVSMVLYSLAEVNRQAGRLREARRQLERVIAIDEKADGAAREDVPGDLEALAAVLRQMGDVKAAEAAEARMRALNEVAAAASEGP